MVLDLPHVPSAPSESGSIASAALTGIVLDDAQAELTGTWSHSTTFKPYIDEGYLFTPERGAARGHDHDFPTRTVQ